MENEAVWVMEWHHWFIVGMAVVFLFIWLSSWFWDCKNCKFAINGRMEGTGICFRDFRGGGGGGYGGYGGGGGGCEGDSGGGCDSGGGGDC